MEPTAPRGGDGKVLLLHGSRQTGDLLLGRIDKLRKKLAKQHLEIVAPTASFACLDDTNDSNNNKNGALRQWWNRSGDTYHGLLEETIPNLLNIWNQHVSSNSPFIGIMGFSQGARLAHLLTLLHEANSAHFFAGLQWTIMVAGYDAPLPTGFQNVYFDGSPPPSTITTPSLHVYGSLDQLIVPQASLEVTKQYRNPQVHEHEGGHHVPMKAASVRTYETFIQSATQQQQQQQQQTLEYHPTCEPLVSDSQPQTTKTLIEEPDQDNAQQQSDEVQALEAIFPEEFHLLSKSAVDERTGDVVYQHPIRYQVDLVPSDEGVWPPHPLAIEFEYPFNYPQEELPKFRLVHENNMMEFSTSQAAALMQTMVDAAQVEEGMPCVMSCIYAARDFFESGGMMTIATTTTTTTTSIPSSSLPVDATLTETDGDESEPSNSPTTSLIRKCSRERLETCNQQGLDIALKVLKQMGKQVSEQRIGNVESKDVEGGDSVHGRGGHWTFTIGLVGKPSAGKSTFFNAATAFARQRDDSDNLLGGATMAPHPFTTIDPNVGYCFVPAPPRSCPEDDQGLNEERREMVGCTHGRDHCGRRLLPILLKDVAGLVPGAYQGRGRGNKFLNDLTDADVLIHVLDASGTADVEGNDMGTEMDGSTSAEASDPFNDMAWIRTEVLEWVFTNLMYKWDSIQRKGRNKLADMFAGYGQNRAVTNNVLVAVEKYMESKEGGNWEHPLDRIETWDEGDVHRLVSAFLGVRFPMALALNKYDLPTSSAHVSKIQTSLPLHGAHVGTPLSAREEMNFIRHHIEQSLGIAPSRDSLERKGDQNPNQKVPEGVWKCLQSALTLREPILVFPVSDFVTYAPLPGMFKHATNDPSLPSGGFIQCLQAAGGSAPSLWNTETKSYPTSLDSNSKNLSPMLRDVLIMKPGSTVENVFMTLKRLGALSGEFVRAEAAGSLDAPSRPIPKSQSMSRSNCILKIMTNKRSSWQKK